MYLVHFVVFAVVLQHIAPCAAWLHSNLIYHRKSRTSDDWKRHAARIDSDGNFVREQLFDAAILTRDFYGSQNKDLTSAIFNESELNEILDDFFTQASYLDQALTQVFRETLQMAPNPTHISIGVPTFTSQDITMELGGSKYRMSDPKQRVQAAMWYVSGIISRARKVTWRNLVLYGTYYIREDLITEQNDPNFARDLNRATQEKGLSTVWVPYYDAPNAWLGKDLGFNVTVVQPRYAFLSSIDGGDLKGDRLYNTGYKSASLGQNFEYEVRSNGESALEHYVAHQYLAISQFTGADRYPQVFFVGGVETYGDFFDRVKGSKDTSPYTWSTYQDLANYLRGDSIMNLEVGIDVPPLPDDSNRVQTRWIVPDGCENFNSIRLDFVDPNPTNWWRGTVLVTVGSETSFSQRIGSEKVIPDYNAVFVPVGNLPSPRGTAVTIQITRERGSTWPRIHRLIAAKYEPPVIASSVFREWSGSSRPNTASQYKDSQPTHVQFGQGKLTDGKISPVNGFWWDGAMGWYWIEYPISVTLDLGSTQSVSSVKVVGHHSPPAAANLPNKLGAMAASSCQPQLRGLVGRSCLPTATTGSISMATTEGSLRNLTMSFLSTTSARYVTVSGLAMAWTLFDEIEVIAPDGRVISVGAPYRVTPITGQITDGSQPVYGDNNQRLVDGNVFSQWIFGTGSDGITAVDERNGGTAEATWDAPQRADFAYVWFTEANPGSGVRRPDSVNVQWRDSGFAWQGPVNVAPSDCGPSPCAKLQLPRGTQVTGVRAQFPPHTWYMVTEISVL